MRYMKENSNEETKKHAKHSKKKGKMSTFKKVMLIILLIIVILLGVGAGTGFWYVNDKLGKMNYVHIAEEDIEVTEGIDEKMNGYRTIAIFGVDSRKR